MVEGQDKLTDDIFVFLRTLYRFKVSYHFWRQYHCQVPCMQTFFRASSFLPIPKSANRKAEKFTVPDPEPEISGRPGLQKKFSAFRIRASVKSKNKEGTEPLPWIRQPRVDKAYLAFFVLLGFLFLLSIRLNRGPCFKGELILTCKRTSLNHWGYKVYPLNVSWFVGVVFRDFRKAFDPVNNEVLRYKL